MFTLNTRPWGQRRPSCRKTQPPPRALVGRPGPPISTWAFNNLSFGTRISRCAQRVLAEASERSHRFCAIESDRKVSSDR